MTNDRARGVVAPQTKTKAQRRLKVFRAVFGFHESVVAAPSQAAALSAWGAHQNLFGEGAAKPVTDPEVMAAALAHPMTPLRRAVGSTGPFSLDAPPPSLDIARSPAKPRSGKRVKPVPSKPEPPQPDRSALAAAEAALEQLEAAQKREQQDIRRRREALDAEEAGARARWTRDRAAARKAMERERRAYLKAVGGR